MDKNANMSLFTPQAFTVASPLATALVVVFDAYFVGLAGDEIIQKGLGNITHPKRHLID